MIAENKIFDCNYTLYVKSSNCCKRMLLTYFLLIDHTGINFIRYSLIKFIYQKVYNNFTHRQVLILN
jgi:hypothetical protein